MEALHLMISFVTLLLGVNMTLAKVCYLGNEPGPDKASGLRWALAPGTDPCECGRIAIGGVNIMALGSRSPQPRYLDALVFSTEWEEFRQWFNCPDVLDITTPVPKAVNQTTVRDQTLASDCQELSIAGNHVSGVYTIYPSQYPQGLQVYCDMDNSRGWIVFQRRKDGSVDFNRGWDEYRGGFGDLAGEFWLGNEALHRLTGGASGEMWEMRVDLTDEYGSAGHAVYERFSIQDSPYTLHAGSHGPNSTIGDSLTAGHDGVAFSTFDRDNDEDVINCAQMSMGGWWFKRCSDVQSNLNGEYHAPNWPSDFRGMKWETGSGKPIEKCAMKMRRLASTQRARIG